MEMMSSRSCWSDLLRSSCCLPRTPPGWWTRPWRAPSRRAPPCASAVPASDCTLWGEKYGPSFCKQTRDFLCDFSEDLCSLRQGKSSQTPVCQLKFSRANKNKKQKLASRRRVGARQTASWSSLIFKRAAWACSMQLAGCSHHSAPPLGWDSNRGGCLNLTFSQPQYIL